jgi:Trm5-related predicted tRNA methylase
MSRFTGRRKRNRGKISGIARSLDISKRVSRRKLSLRGSRSQV